MRLDSKSARLQSRLETYQRRLEWLRAHNIYGIVNGEPGWVYEQEIELYETLVESIESELPIAEAEDALVILDIEMGEYEQTKFENKVKKMMPVLFMWIPCVAALLYGAGMYAVNVLVIVCLILIARNAGVKIGIFKRH